MISVRKIRKIGVRKQVAVALTMAMIFSGVGPAFLSPVRVNAQVQAAPIGQGFPIVADDLRFIYQQILVAQAHAAGGQLLGNGPNQVADPQLPRGLRTVDGSMNNLVPVPDQHLFGAADRTFPRVTSPLLPNAEPLPFDPDGPGPQAAGQPTSYTQSTGFVADSQPRVITNAIVDQSASNPAAVAAATNPCGSGGFVCQGSTAPDPDSGALFIPNITPDFGLSAPYNLMFTFFGQFFDHGLDLVPKSGGTVIMPLRPDDPLFVAPTATNPNPPNFMVMTRGETTSILPGPDGILGTSDDIRNSMNLTTPWVDQNQTYTSHPSHQVFLRQYMLVNNRPLPDGLVLDGSPASCAARPGITVGISTDGTPDEICNIGNWAEVKAQAATKLGIQLVDQDVFDVPLILTDPYGHFKPGPNGLPQIVLKPLTPGGANRLLEGNLATPVLVPSDAFRTGHAFLNDIAHSAVPTAGGPDADLVAGKSLDTPQPPGTYDNELLDAHFITGDGRGNENIALTMVHNIFHAEHNRLAHQIDRMINTPGLFSATEVANWKAVDGPSGWGYGERLFQAARFITEMQYQHLVFEEFARRVQPLINPFLGGITSIDAAISAEFAHTVYRLGHSMLPERIDRINAGSPVPDNSIRLLDAFLNPTGYNDGGPAGPLTADKAAGAIIRGTSRQVGNELDEFVTSSVRNTLVGLPLDLAAINIARGRSEGIPPLNNVRNQIYTRTKDAALKPYANWFEFGLALRHSDSLANFVAAYGTDPSVRDSGPDGILGTPDDVTTVAAKRAAAQLLLANATFMQGPSSSTGLDKVDFWIGGLAEKPNVFGGLLGSTFNFVFEHQLEDLQNGDRFYYLQRTDGLSLRFSLEGNSFAELCRRNTDMDASMDILFSTPDFIFEGSQLDPTSTTTIDLGGGMSLLTLVDGTKLFNDPLHTGKNVVFYGGSGDDKFASDIGDDTFFGNGGNDRIDGGEGNDTLLGGDGDDQLFGGNGDDVLKGGPGNDALSTGPGFGADLAIGGEGNDFMVGGDDGVEYFGGPGNDIIVDGAMRSEGIFGGDGDDWIYDGDGHDGGIFGDGGNVFDLLAGLGQVGGDDVEGGGPGQDNHFGEGGDDVFLMSEGSNKFFGDYGFDWFTMRGWPAPGDIQLNLLAIPGVVLNFNDLRNFYRLVDGASGWDLDDSIIGDNTTADPAAAPLVPELFRQPQYALTVEGANKIAGLAAEVASFGIVANGTTVTYCAGGTAICGEQQVKQFLFNGGNILLGGLGSDTITGGGGIDLIDGDAWFNVRLSALMNDKTTKVVDSPLDLVDDVLSTPQRLNPGNITIVRSVVTPTPGTGLGQVPPADCGATAPRNCDTAVYHGAQAGFVITKNSAGIVTITDVANAGKFGQNADGTEKNAETDYLKNMEQARFIDNTTTPPTITTVDLTTLAVTATTTIGPAIAASVTVTSAGAANALTSPALTASANTLLVALIAADGGTGAQTNTVNAVTNSAPRGTTALTWTRAVAAGAQPGTAEIWWAFTPTAIGTTTVKAKFARANPSAMTVMAFTGASSTLAAITAARSGAAGTIPTAPLTTTSTSSLVVGVGVDQGTPGLMTPAAGQVIVNQFSPTGGDTYWSQRTSAPVAASGTTVNISATPAGARGAWNLALLEIKRQ